MHADGVVDGLGVAGRVGFPLDRFLVSPRIVEGREGRRGTEARVLVAGLREVRRDPGVLLAVLLRAFRRLRVVCSWSGRCTWRRTRRSRPCTSRADLGLAVQADRGAAGKRSVKRDLLRPAAARHDGIRRVVEDDAVVGAFREPDRGVRHRREGQLLLGRRAILVGVERLELRNVAHDRARLQRRPWVEDVRHPVCMERECSSAARGARAATPNRLAANGNVIAGIYA